jgi:ribonuclease P protein component
MISSKYRFHGHGSLNYLHRNGETARGSMMAARFAPNKHRELPRFAVVVSKKVYKSAVKRNRIRRRIYEIIRQTVTDSSPSIDIAINVYDPEVLDLPQPKLEREVRDLLKSAGL